MENFDISKIPSGDEPIPLNNTGSAGVSHSPLNLGGGDSAKPLKIEAPAKPARPTAINPAEIASPAGRITGVKTFFTKLHGGAIEFLDDIIIKWLKDNPEVSIKHTNIITGEIQGKKTEPNIIVTVWY